MGRERLLNEHRACFFVRKVYIGMNEHTAELFAVKQMLVDSERTRMSLEREIELMKQLSHPNIVRYLRSRAHTALVSQEEQRNNKITDLLQCCNAAMTPSNVKNK